MSHVRDVASLPRQWLATWHIKFVMIDDIDLTYQSFLSIKFDLIEDIDLITIIQDDSRKIIEI